MKDCNRHWKQISYLIATKKYTKGTADTQKREVEKMQINLPTVALVSGQHGGEGAALGTRILASFLTCAGAAFDSEKKLLAEGASRMGAAECVYV
jgi:hypothetical protein